ncbi:MAG: hypothetical protein LBK50_03250 [Candidatus Nomurabacteria bacterium]|jgi:hypothetical protein|nr:hypothetical protein [Candidatus Nomurabacteria bacterium]
MIEHLDLSLNDTEEATIDQAYINLLKSKASFAVMKVNDENYILTKEKSFFKVDDVENFIKEADDDVYFKTVFVKDGKYLKRDLDLYFEYLNKYQDRMMKQYGDKYLFGSIAVKTTDGNFITTIRGKENFDEFTVVTSVDYDKNILFVDSKKATLNAPLLYNLLKNDNTKTIVHINHQFDDGLPFLPYAFPGTTKDSMRDIKESFNISHHGLFLLFDSDGNIIRSNKS